MIMIPLNAGARAFAIDWFLEDIAAGRASPDTASDMLGQLRMIGDLANLERLSRLLAEQRQG